MDTTEDIPAEEDFGGALGAYLFPTIISVSSICLSIIYATIAVQFNLHLAPDYFVAICASISALTSIPLAFIAALRERRKFKTHVALQSIASTDALTGLLNRRAFTLSLHEELARMQRTGKTGALILFDLDEFKKLNDLHGHDAGDQMLTAVAATAHTELRSPLDRLARWGGEEFIILVHDVTEETAHIVCERLRDQIEKLVLTVGDKKLKITASFGGMILQGHDTFAAAFGQADRALYRAKAEGRNCIAFAEKVRAAA